MVVLHSGRSCFEEENLITSGNLRWPQQTWVISECSLLLTANLFFFFFFCCKNIIKRGPLEKWPPPRPPPPQIYAVQSCMQRTIITSSHGSSFCFSITICHQIPLFLRVKAEAETFKITLLFSTRLGACTWCSGVTPTPTSECHYRCSQASCITQSVSNRRDTAKSIWP